MTQLTTVSPVPRGACLDKVDAVTCSNVLQRCYVFNGKEILLVIVVNVVATQQQQPNQRRDGARVVVDPSFRCLPSEAALPRWGNFLILLGNLDDTIKDVIPDG